MHSIDKQKHILVINRSFWPDTEATGQFLTELCEELVEKYKITVIAGRSYYGTGEFFKPFRFYSRDAFNSVKILRTRHTRFWKGSLIGRILNWCSYGILAFIGALKTKTDLIIACTDPPFLGIIAMVLAWLKQIPFIYNCRDLYPDVAWELGRLKRGNFLGQLFDYCNKKAFYAARIVVPLGISMKDRLRIKRVSEEHIRIIPDWVDVSIIKPVAKKDNFLLEKLGLKDKFIVMYSGNIGLSQDLSSILHAVSMIKGHPSFYLIFIGEGVAKESLQNEARLLGLKNVLFFPYQPQDLLSFSLSIGDLHLIPLKKGMAGTIIPSKMYGIMAAARPYLAITDKESEPAVLGKEYGCGLWVEPDNVEKITESLEWALGHPADLEKMGQAGRHVVETKFDKSIVINEWFKLLDTL